VRAAALELDIDSEEIEIASIHGGFAGSPAAAQAQALDAALVDQLCEEIEAISGVGRERVPSDVAAALGLLRSSSGSGSGSGWLRSRRASFQPINRRT
jgi:hypothetical protein